MEQKGFQNIHADPVERISVDVNVHKKMAKENCRCSWRRRFTARCGGAREQDDKQLDYCTVDWHTKKRNGEKRKVNQSNGTSKKNEDPLWSLRLDLAHSTCFFALSFFLGALGFLGSFYFGSCEMARFFIIKLCLMYGNGFRCLRFFVWLVLIRSGFFFNFSVLLVDEQKRTQEKDRTMATIETERQRE